MRFFSLVSEHVGRNPVARAIARHALDTSLREFQLQLYGLPTGSVQADNIAAAGRVLAVALEVCPQGIRRDLMQDARGALESMAHDGFKWLADEAGSVDIGMHVAHQALRAAKASDVQQAYTKTMEAA